MRLRRAASLVVLTLVGVPFALAPEAAGVSPADLGALDPSFGQAGISWGPDGGTPVALGGQPDGRLLVAFRFAPSGMAIVRIDTDGLADPSFGTGGTVPAPVSGFVPHDLALAADGSFAVVGSAPQGLTDVGVVARYDADGALLATFDTDGVATVDPFGSGARLSGIAFAGDGDLIVTGDADRPSADPAGLYALATRLDATGAVDPTFGDAGVLAFTTARPRAGGTFVYQDSLGALRERPDGSFLVEAMGDPNTRAVVAMTTDGQIDASACGGRWVFEGRAWGGFEATTDGVLLAGRVNGPTSYDAAVDRWVCDGSGLHPDAAFGDAGRAAFGVPWSIDQGYGLLQTAEGSTVVVGYEAGDSAGDDLLLARLGPSGTADPSVGRDGLFSIDLGANERAWFARQFDDGRIVVAFSTTGGLRSGGVVAIGSHALDQRAPDATIIRPVDGERYSSLGMQAIRGASDDGTGQLARTLVALRLRRADGSCAWMGRTAWTDGPCAQPRWHNAGPKRAWVWDLPRRLRDSPGPARYTAFARSLDTAGNTSPTRAGSNVVRFDIGV